MVGTRILFDLFCRIFLGPAYPEASFPSFSDSQSHKTLLASEITSIFSTMKKNPPSLLALLPMNLFFAHSLNDPPRPQKVSRGLIA